MKRIDGTKDGSQSALFGLGQALRWLRERRARKQYQVAADAGITKGMLSAYETGRQRPSVETLEKLLTTLGCDLSDLHNAIQIVNGRPERLRNWQSATAPFSPPPASEIREPGPGAPAFAGRSGTDDATGGAAFRPAGGVNGGSQRATAADTVQEPEAAAWWPDLRQVIGAGPDEWLAPEEERALAQMLGGFHRLLRYWHRSLYRARQGQP